MLANLIAFAGAALLLAMVPGPSTALVLRQTLRGGRRRAFVTSLGNVTGLLFWSVAAAFGLSALVVASQAAYDAIKVTGAIVLIVLGVQSLLRSRQASSPEVPQPKATDSAGTWPAFRLGLLTNLANPKAAVFALSFLPQFVPPHAPVLATILLLALIQVVVDIAWYALLAWFVSRARLLLSRAAVRRRLEQASGVVLIGFGLRLAVETR